MMEKIELVQKESGMSVNPMVYYIIQLSWYLFDLFLLLDFEHKNKCQTTTKQNFHSHYIKKELFHWIKKGL